MQFCCSIAFSLYRMRLIFNLRSLNRVTDALARIYWSRAPERLRFKMAVVSYRCVSIELRRRVCPNSDCSRTFLVAVVVGLLVPSLPATCLSCSLFYLRSAGVSDFWFKGLEWPLMTSFQPRRFLPSARASNDLTA